MDACGRGGDFLRLSVPSSDAALKHLLIRECLPMNGRSEEQPRSLSRRRVLSPMNQHYQVLPTVSIYPPGGRQGVASSGLVSTRRAALLARRAEFKLRRRSFPRGASRFQTSRWKAVDGNLGGYGRYSSECHNELSWLRCGRDRPTGYGRAPRIRQRRTAAADADPSLRSTSDSARAAGRR